MPEEPTRLTVYGYRTGLVIWAAGLGALLVNLWWARYSNSSGLLWAAAAGAVLVGSVVAGYFAEKTKSDTTGFAQASAYALAAAGGAGFFFLVAVMPATSNSGQLAMSFLEAVEDKRYDEAYEMLSEDAQQRIPRDKFEQRLPEHFHAQTGSEINSVQGGVGTSAGTCVEGWLDVPDEMTGRFAMSMSEADDGSLKIEKFARWQACPH